MGSIDWRIVFLFLSVPDEYSRKALLKFSPFVTSGNYSCFLEDIGNIGAIAAGAPANVVSGMVDEPHQAFFGATSLEIPFE